MGDLGGARSVVSGGTCPVYAWRVRTKWGVYTAAVDKDRSHGWFLFRRPIVAWWCGCGVWYQASELLAVLSVCLL
jgi:hypothetical protein